MQGETSRPLLPSSGKLEVLQVVPQRLEFCPHSQPDDLPAQTPGFRLGCVHLYVLEGGVIAGGKYQKGRREERI